MGDWGETLVPLGRDPAGYRLPAAGKKKKEEKKKVGSVGHPWARLAGSG
ncbi:MAG: hypothetical protein Q8Q29_05100 [Actinomycetota bacterium]|nr:hypothetical protein [Actinomycetota bacterium]